MYTYTKRQFDSTDNLIKIMESCLIDSNYFNWKNIQNMSRFEGFNEGVFNSFTYDSILRINNTIDYFNTKLDVTGSTAIINPHEDARKLIFRTDDLVFNYDSSKTIYKNIIDGNNNKCLGLFSNFDSDYFFENTNVYNMTISSIYNNKQYECYSNNTTIPIYELLGSILTTEVGILIDKDYIFMNEVTIDKLINRSLNMKLNNELNINSINKINLNTSVINIDSSIFKTSNNVDLGKLVLEGTTIKLKNLNGNDYKLTLDTSNNRIKVVLV